MILFDPEQSEAVAGDSRAGLPARPTLMRYLREAQSAVGLKGEVSVLLTTDDGIRALNRRFRKKNKATDVLSFPVDDPSFGSAGDLAISVETAARQAREQGHLLRVELRVLMLHGLLHLAGMDHETDEGKMARKERRLREKLGLPLGLIERVTGVGGRKELTSGAKAPVRRAGSTLGMNPRPTSKRTLPYSEPEQQIPLRGMTERKATATANARGEADSLTGMTERKATATAKAKVGAEPTAKRVRGGAR